MRGLTTHFKAMVGKDPMRQTREVAARLG